MIKAFKLPKWPLILIAFWIACAHLSANGGYTIAKSLAFNMLLAVIPLLLAYAAVYIKQRLISLCLWALWLLFLPNTFYMITDIIHAPQNMEWVTADWLVMHSSNINSWLFIIILGTGCILAFLFGLESMQLAFGQIKKRFSLATAYIFAAAVSFLCGLGIFLGRFLRLNSWDILNPLSLLRKVLNGLNLFAVQIIFIFSAGIFLMFCFYRWFLKRN